MTRSILCILSCREGYRAAIWPGELLSLEMYQYRLWGQECGGEGGGEEAGGPAM